MTARYVSSERDPTNFTDESIPEGVGPASRLLLKFGIFFFDYDLDGYLDLFTANGHIEEEINKVQKSQTYAQPAQLFWNSGGSQATGFIPVPPEKCGPDIFRPIVGRGSAFADIDGDGRPRCCLDRQGPLVLRNDQALNHHWLRVKLVGKKNNRDAIGAWVRVRPNNHILARQVMPTRSYLSQSELPVTIGLGEAKEIGEVEVVWPGGAIQKVQGLVLDQLNRVEEAH